jgi:type I restriction enzyme M protein
MVRLSLVNLYLHGFTEPHIYEYDTLTSEERWNEFADVILANPPFMSPKGGIKPHRRFSIQAKRSEVLFVDYMAEHLTPTGRAGIIVPEGIIFQSQTAYKELRKLLVENSLVAVVSLPAGCFNPYSGVKTSILLLDKSLARQSDTIGFFKVENDGFGLGAQRRAIEKNDLPQVQAELAAYLHALRSKSSIESILSLTSTAQIVPKEKIAANGDYNLSGERYRDGASGRLSSYEFRKLGDLCRLRTGKKDVNSGNESGQYPFFTCARQHTYSNEYSFDAEAILIAGNGDVGAVQYYSGKFEAYQRTYVLTDWVSIEGRFLYFLLSDRLKETVSKLKQGNTMPYIKLGMLTEFEIPLPPLEVQKEIVAEIEGYQKVINGARAVLDHYRPHIPIHPDWPETPLGEVCRFIDYRGKTPEKTASGLPLITAKNVREGYINPEPREFIAEADYDAWMTRGIPQIGDVLFTMEAPLGNVAEITMKGRFALAQRLVALCPNRKILIGAFLKDLLLTRTLQDKILAHQSGTTVYGIKASVLKELTIPLPPVATQQAIVAEIEAEQALVAANRELITRFERKIQATLARIWGEEEAAPISPAVPFEAFEEPELLVAESAAKYG